MTPRILVWVCFCIAATGCLKPKSTNEWLGFSQLNQEEASRYYFVEPFSAEFLAFIASEHKGTVDSIIAGVERRKNSPEALARYLEKLKCIDWASEFDWIDERAAEELKKGGQAYFFKYRKHTGEETYTDFGVLIVRNQRIVYRAKGGEATIGKAVDLPQPTR